MPRAYRSDLREQQAAATRERIVDSAWALLRTTRPVDLSYAAVAAEAGVSKRTVYRHFPTPDDLFMAVSDRIFGDLEPAPQDRMDMRQAIDMLARQFEQMEADPAIFRAYFAVPSRSRGDANALIERLFARQLARLPAPHRAAAGGLLDLLCSPYAWDVLHGNWGADAKQTLRATQVAVRALLAYLETHPNHLDPDGPDLVADLESST